MLCIGARVSTQLRVSKWFWSHLKAEVSVSVRIKASKPPMLAKSRESKRCCINCQLENSAGAASVGHLAMMSTYTKHTAVSFPQKCDTKLLPFAYCCVNCYCLLLRKLVVDSLACVSAWWITGGEAAQGMKALGDDECFRS